MIYLLALTAFLWPFVAYFFYRRKEKQDQALRDRIDAVIRGAR